MNHTWTKEDIDRGLECICKMDLILDDIAYFESRGLLYHQMKQKAKRFKEEIGKHIDTFFKNSDEETQKEYYSKIEELKLKIKL